MEQVTLEAVDKKVERLTEIVISLQEIIEDSFLTAEEEMILDEARAELKEGKTISLEDLEKERNAN